jgi:hypothetical protein
MKRPLFALLLTVAVGASPAFAAGPSTPNTIELASSKIHLGDVVPTAPADLAPLEIGAAPAPGASRILAQSDILRSVPEDRRASIAAPAAVRIVRKTQRLDSAAIDALTRNALKSSGLPRGATLGAVRAPASLVVPAGYDRVTATVAKPPRRQGAFDTTVGLDLYGGTEVVAHLSVPVQLVLGPEAAQTDVASGATISLVVRRGLVEVSSAATASSAGDVGDVIQVVVRDTGKALRAQLVAKDRAVAVEGS